ncbi:hypothetical protein E2C01_054286 [Portunus trituberculatus]|uniref:Uncharacterized protein n=1 Tax=Portunus trituberculatus TaxID=210409 RepID=A0A5B7GSS6_PORTR|nr:hypothetical protein [Portunus trituberculatus]
MGFEIGGTQKTISFGAAVVQWNHACFGVQGVSKRTGSNPVHGLIAMRLSVSAIRGYRCALASVLRQSGIDPSTDPDLSSMFRSFVVSCPSRLPQLPAWDLSLVLRSSLHPPYEPLRIALLRDV